MLALIVPTTSDLGTTLEQNQPQTEPLIILHGTRSPDDIIVDVNGSGDYTTIQQGIDNASSGDTIYVYQGIYVENVLVNKTVTLIGNGTINTTIDGNRNGNPITIETDYINISHFKITNGTIAETNAGILLDDAGNHSTFDNNHIIDNRYGIKLVNSAITYNNITVSNNTIEDSRMAIIFDDCERVTAFNNTIQDIDYYGISITNSEYIDIINNTITSPDQANIYVLYSDKGNITGNNMNGSDKGIDIDTGNDFTISNNRFEGITSEAIYLMDGNQLTIINNTFIECDIGIFIDIGSDNTIYHNNFIDCDTSAQDYDGSNTWNAPYPNGGNYFSDYTGADTNIGEDQNNSGMDRIGDTSYSVAGSGTDNFPYMFENGWLYQTKGIELTKDIWNFKGYPGQLKMNITDLFSTIPNCQAIVGKNMTRGYWNTYYPSIFIEYWDIEFGEGLFILVEVDVTWEVYEYSVETTIEGEKWQPAAYTNTVNRSVTGIYTEVTNCTALSSKNHTSGYWYTYMPGVGLEETWDLAFGDGIFVLASSDTSWDHT